LKEAWRIVAKNKGAEGVDGVTVEDLERQDPEDYKATLQGKTEVIDIDIKGIFDNIPHRELMNQVARRIVDRKVLSLIKQWLKARVKDKEIIKKNRKGTPQGGVVSPLLANIYLDRL
jgi:retron-type reverse transcriptase